MRQLLLQLPPEAPFGLAILGFTLAALALVWGFWTLHKARLIENMPTSRVPSAAQGYLELEGRLKLLPGPKIVSPLTRTPCVWWRYAIYERGGRDRRGNWQLVEEQTGDDLFLLDDGSGECIVDAEGARVTPTKRWTWYGDFWKPRIGPRHGAGLWNALRRRFKYVEELIYLNDPAYALGWFRSQSNVATNLDEGLEVSLLMKEWKADRRKMATFDVNKDGQVDSKEWEAARRVALEQVRREHLQRATDPDLHVLCRPPDRRPYVIHSGTQEALVRRYRRLALSAFGVAAAMGGAAAWILQLRGMA